MVTIVKHEWHSHDRQYAIELDEDLLQEIYPDLKKKEIKKLLKDIEKGEVDFEEVINDAWSNDVDIDWEFQYDDCYSDRKGGYDVTYELGDENSWVEPEQPPEPTHKCTNCKWQGQSYDADWVYEDKDGNSLDEPKKACPYCESDVELTEHGKVKEAEMAKFMKEFDEALDAADDESED